MENDSFDEMDVNKKNVKRQSKTNWCHHDRKAHGQFRHYKIALKTLNSGLPLAVQCAKIRKYYARMARLRSADHDSKVIDYQF